VAWSSHYDSASYSGRLSYYDLSGVARSTRFVVEYDDRGAVLRSQEVNVEPGFELTWWQRTFPPWLVGWFTERRNRRLLAEIDEARGEVRE
jgi:hypothetical protein